MAIPPVSAWWLGLLLCALITAASLWVAGLEALLPWGLSALTFAILFGIVLGNTVYPSIAPYTGPGVDFCKTHLLRAGIVLFGFRLTFQEAAAVGTAGVMLDIAVIVSVFGLAVLLGRRVFGMDLQTCMLIGAGSAICGAAAVMAMESVTRADAHKASVAVATVVVFGTVGMFLYPLLFPLLGLTEHAFGIFIGATVHEVAQVVAAGTAVGPEAVKSAVVEKMLRVMMLAPFLMLVSWGLHLKFRKANLTGHGSVRPSIPWFAVGFVMVVGVNSSGFVAHEVAGALGQLSAILLAMAMAALGLHTHANAFRQAGAAPLMLAAVLFAFLLVGGYTLHFLIYSLL